MPSIVILNKNGNPEADDFIPAGQKHCQAFDNIEEMGREGNQAHCEPFECASIQKNGRSHRGYNRTFLTDNQNVIPDRLVERERAPGDRTASVGTEMTPFFPFDNFLLINNFCCFRLIDEGLGER